MKFSKLASLLTKSAVLAIALAVAAPAWSAVIPGDKKGFEHGFDLKNYAGQMTFLEFMKSEVHPAIEEVRQSILDGNEDQLDHSTAVDNGQGVAIKIADKNYTYHVNYKISSEENAERSGRSFGLWRNGHMSDPSDRAYLDELDELVHSDRGTIGAFYKALIKIIANCDASGYQKLNGNVEAEGVATDFMTIYIAEEERHIMGDLGSFNWDDALFQVTMLGSFHGGQAEMTMFYQGEFTNQTYDQKNKVYMQPESQEDLETREARMKDYWQFSKNDPNRSGINLTRADFSKMGKWITKYERENHPELIEAVEEDLGGSSGDNIYKEITTFFISKDAPERIESTDANKMATDIAKLMVQIHDDADEITSYISENAN